MASDNSVQLQLLIERQAIVIETLRARAASFAALAAMIEAEERTGPLTEKQAAVFADALAVA